MATIIIAETRCHAHRSVFFHAGHILAMGSCEKKTWKIVKKKKKRVTTHRLNYDCCTILVRLYHD